MNNKPIRRFLRYALSTSLLLVLIAGVVTVHAAFPGANGKIVFASYRDGPTTETYVMNPDGSGQTNLTNNPFYDSVPAWSPDGTKIVFCSNRDDNHENNEVYVMNADGSGPTRLTNNPGLDCEPAWSPDGSKIAFDSERDGNVEIYVMNADGSGQTRLTNNPAWDDHPAWSPDGSKIAFDSDRDGDVEIYVMNADGSGQTRLTNNPAPDDHPDWSPNGAKIVFNSYRDNSSQAEIYVMNADGTGQTNLSNSNSTDEGAPAWSPDGTKIVFHSSLAGNYEIYVMNADGSGVTRLTFNSATDVSPDWQPLPNTCLTLEDISASLQAIIDSNSGTPLADKIEDSLAKTESARAECAKTPPDNQAAIGNIESAVADLEAAVKDGLLNPGQGIPLMDALAAAARAFAVNTIDEAIAQGGDSQKINEAQQALAAGDVLRASGKFKEAVNQYKDALSKAESALP